MTDPADPPPTATGRPVVAADGVPTTARDHEAGQGQGARRRLALVCVGLLAGAAALEGAARLPWFSASVEAVGRGAVTVSATGADLVPALSAVALLAGAAVAAAVALGGVARRALGGLVAVAGAGVGIAVVRLLLAPPAPADLAALPGAPAGGVAAAGAVVLRPGPLPAALGAALLLVAGVVVLVGERRLPRLGSRYSAQPADTPESARDPDRAAWDALDAGRDPTVDPLAPGRPGRTDGGASDRAV